MERTADFRAAASARSRAARQAAAVLAEEQLASGQPPSQPVARRPAAPSEFVSQALEILEAIGTVRQFLVQSESAYIDASRHIASQASGMDEAARDEIDREASLYLKSCGERIAALDGVLNTLTAERAVGGQLLEHYRGIARYLYEQLQEIASLLGDMQAVRMARARERFADAAAGVKEPAADPLSASIHSATTDRTADERGFVDESELDLDEEERQLLEDEGQVLLEEYEEQVRNAERKVMEIAQLHEMFSNKVLQQAEEIEHLHATYIESTENVKLGNRELIQATRRGVDSRVMILLFLVVLSFGLLFLDWYDG